jgi:hypothetical protein
MQDIITKNKRMLGNRPSNYKTERVFDQATGGARDVSPNEARAIRDRDFEAKQKMDLTKEQNKPAMAELSMRKSQQATENMSSVINRMETDRSRMNARLLAQKPLRDRGPEMLTGLKPEDRLAFMQTAGLAGGVASGSVVERLGPTAQAGLMEKIEKITKDRMESGTLPAGLITDKDGNTVDEATGVKVDPNEVVRNQVKNEIYGQVDSAYQQFSSGQKPADILGAEASARKLGVSLLEQASLNIAPTMEDMSGIQVSQGGGPAVGYEQWDGTKAPYKYTGGKGRGLFFSEGMSDATKQANANADYEQKKAGLEGFYGTVKVTPAAEGQQVESSAKDYLEQKTESGKTDRELKAEKDAELKASGASYEERKAARLEMEKNAALSEKEVKTFKNEFLNKRLPEILSGRNTEKVKKEMPALFDKNITLSDGTKVSLYDQIKQANEAAFSQGGDRKTRQRNLELMFQKNPNLQRKLLDLYLKG